ncbi:hypothetical protein ACE1TI_13550 [Alteribacillus sp. JSM 102045]|uniref:hypothetical protein n=1 Tax=Alteribacillus sp. JSM 102045 TaxID=1562101 RepID=UPI0035C17F67
MKNVVGWICTLIAVIMMVVPQNLNAETTEPEAPDLNEDELKKIEEEAEEIRPYINAEGDYIEFDEEEALKDGVDESLVERTSQDIKNTNDELQNNIDNNNVSALSSCGGVNGINDNWYDVVIYLDSCKSDQLAGALSAGSGAATIAAIIPGAHSLPSGVLAGIAAIGAGAVTSANAGDTGIRMRFTNSGGLYWIHSQ